MELKHAMDSITSSSEDFGVGQENGLLIRDELHHQESTWSLEADFLRRVAHQRPKKDQDDSEIHVMEFEDEEDADDDEDEDDYYGAIEFMKYYEIKNRINNLFNSGYVVMENREGNSLANCPEINDSDQTMYYFYDPLKELDQSGVKKLKVDICNCGGTSRFGCQNCQTIQISFRLCPEEGSSDELGRLMEKAWTS
eukprot:GHVP01035172.1.p1 GENE.GHVP01035172.1~~GHVP01035172.1.p1  ORF type:complete len:196 (+),score=38.34 GHVP01035172.1:391-978(+)